MTQYDGSSVLDAIRAVQAADGLPGAMGALSRFVERYGFERIYLGQLVNPAAVATRDMLYASDWPDELQAERRSQMAILHDPVARCALTARRPFRWQEAHAQATREGRRVIDMVHNYGITDGIMFPMHAINHLPGGVSLGSGAALDLSPAQVLELEIVCQAAYYHLEASQGPFPYQKLAQLTARETECVGFAAAGKTNWEIATILGIREDTVKKTLKRASEKLGAVNRAQLVASAIRTGRIFP
ncbi:MAG: helix-turn-helix transcriptional regulator [Hyphomonas sp.]